MPGTLRPAVGHTLHAAHPIERFQFNTLHIVGMAVIAEGRIHVAVQFQTHRVTRRQETYGQRVARLRIHSNSAFGHHKRLRRRLARHKQKKNEENGEITFHISRIHAAHMDIREHHVLMVCFHSRDHILRIR